MAFIEGTPPPEEYQKWCDELNAELPDLPDATEDSLRSKYNFRIGVRENNHVPSTYLDQDESGTFDPACRKPLECIPIIRKKRERRERADDGISKKIKSNTWQGGRQMGRQLLVVLKMTSEVGQAALRDFGTSLDNCPEHSLDQDNSDDSQTDSPGSQAQPYDFRERRRRDLSDITNAAGDDDLRLEDLTLGHPAQRGCKACFEWGFRCPLLDEGSRYPCAECTVDNTECELILEPAVKRTCEGCKSRRQQCSYREVESDHTGPCKQCANASRKCVAGPASGRTRTGPSLDQAASRPYRKQNAQPRKYRLQPQKQNAIPQTLSVDCSDSLRDREWYPCTTDRECAGRNNCWNKSTALTIASLDHQTIKIDKGKERERGICSDKQRKPTTAESKQRHVITTKLAHPIQFNYAYDDNDGIAPCHWCEDAIYGILGLGEIEVEVIDNGDDQGFVEIAGGHTETYGRSRMCEFCTTDRLKTTVCKSHELQPIDGMDPENFDYNAVMEWMMPGMASVAPFGWCSICPGPAFYCCSTKPEIDMEGQENLYLGDQKGCGLILCESCALTLVSEHEGKLEKLLDSLEKDGGDGGFGIRADASFLHPEGELLRRMEAF